MAAPPSTLKQLTNRWLKAAEERGVGAPTVVTYNNAARQVLESLGNLKLTDCHIDMLKDIQGASKRNNSGEGARRIYAMVLKWGAQMGWVPKANTKKTPPPKRLSELLTWWANTRKGEVATRTWKDYNYAIRTTLKKVPDYKLSDLRHWHGNALNSKEKWIFRRSIRDSIEEGWIKADVVAAPAPTPDPDEEDVTDPATAGNPRWEPTEPSGENEYLSVALTPLEQVYAESMADPDQHVEEYLRFLVMEDCTDGAPYDHQLAATQTAEPCISFQVGIPKEYMGHMDERRDALDFSRYLRGLLLVKIYGKKAVLVARRQGVTPLDALRKAMERYTVAPSIEAVL